MKRGPTAKNPKKNLVNQSQLADIFEISQPAVVEWIQKDDFPIYEKSSTSQKETRYSTRDVIDWYLGIADYNAQKTRLTKAQADRIELEIAEKTKQLSSTAEYIKFAQELVTTVKYNLRDIAKTVGQQHDEIATCEELEYVIQELIDAALNTLAKGFEGYVERL